MNNPELYQLEDPLSNRSHLFLTETMSKKKLPPVVAAMLTRDAARVRAAIETGAKVDQPDSDGRTGLHHAAIGEDLGVLKVLLDAGANPRRQDGQGGSGPAAFLR
jgi:ankyrin repeat protein